MTYVGGLRDRLILDSVRYHLHGGLEQLGWFDSGRPHQPVQILVEPVENLTEILPNIVAIYDESVEEYEAETGSNLTEFVWSYAVDIFAENSAVGRHLYGDVKSIFEGRFSGYSLRPQVSVLDWTAATPSEIFVCQVENIVGGRQKNWSKPYEKYYWTILFELIDHYESDL